ncbi:MAG: class I SAM-dependent methyltransferase [Thermoflexus sp.]|uniref:class I SAM-dependent DNA methyltransferase n=1 Tax=Thermoflexus sp. TaxID=1969742 RepID=UPI0025E7DA40|nr:class I SAM-dependent methyltransferase [Thermoflexus sp.]MCS6963371.1 class I SAM-dependent methyltransferase [Thermoflexus sp.]MDW8185319.1 class I SAM-dependent methyltransferase [Anaerolineae bacterium]
MWTRWLPPEGEIRLLDVGCGTAEEAGEFLASGRVVDFLGVDLDEGAIAQARARWPEARWICADAARLSSKTLGGRFDAILIRRPDLLLQPARWRRVFRRLSEWLRPGGWIIVTVIGDGEAELARRWLEEAGLRVFRVERLPWPEERVLLLAGHAGCPEGLSGEEGDG